MQSINYYKEILDTISEGNIVVAINILKNRISELQDWAMMDECVTIEQTYHAMLRFFAQGAKDEHRDDVYCDILVRLVDVAQRLERKSKIKHDSSLLYSKIRIVTRQARTLQYYTNRLKTNRQQALFLSIMEQNDENTDDTCRKLLEELFDYLWVATQFSKDDIDSLKELFATDYLNSYEKAWMVSALSLSALSYFHISKIQILSDIIDTTDGVVQCRAFVGVALIIMLHHKTISALRLDKKLSIFTSSANSATWSVLQVLLFTTYNTRRVRKQFTDQIFPLISQLQANVGNPENLLDILQDESAELPPEIDPSLLHKIHNRIQKVNDQVMQGLDVYYEQFSQLKAYSFFHEVRNWFMPFELCSSESRDQLHNLSILMGHSNLCDSDKHSLLATIGMMPSQQMEFIKQQIQQLDIHNVSNENQDIDIRLHENYRQLCDTLDLSQATSPSLAYAQFYLQDLYRFFFIKMKGEHDHNPFEADSLLLFANHMVCDEMINTSDSYVITMQAYAMKLYRHTLNLLPMCDEDEADRLLVIQGLCHSVLGEHAEAIDAFELHDLNYGNMPSEAKIVYANSLSADMQYEKAVKVYETIPPDEMIDQIGYASALSTLGRYEDSLNLLYKEDFLNPGQIEIQRHIAHDLLYINKPDQAMRYCQQILSTHSPKPKDYLIAGHCQLVAGDIPKALQYYKNVVRLEPHSPLFNTEDKDLLLDLGVSLVTVNLIADAATAKTPLS